MFHWQNKECRCLITLSVTWIDIAAKAALEKMKIAIFIFGGHHFDYMTRNLIWLKKLCNSGKPFLYAHFRLQTVKQLYNGTYNVYYNVEFTYDIQCQIACRHFFCKVRSISFRDEGLLAFQEIRLPNLYSGLPAISSM